MYSRTKTIILILIALSVSVTSVIASGHVIYLKCSFPGMQLKPDRKLEWPVKKTHDFLVDSTNKTLHSIDRKKDYYIKSWSEHSIVACETRSKCHNEDYFWIININRYTLKVTRDTADFHSWGTCRKLVDRKI